MMKNLAMIACIGKDGGLGYHGELLWRFKEDQKFFRGTTMGYPIVMGGKTFASIGRPLPGRENIVLSRSVKGDDNVKVFTDKAELDEYLGQLPNQKFIIGGASLYEIYLPEAETIYLTEVEATKPADAFFPEFDRNKYERQVIEEGMVDKNKYRIIKYTRKANV